MLTAAQVTRDAGVTLRRRGGREWACCPLHREKTPPMCFYPDGRFHCFGCYRSGDAADLYAALYGVGLGEALCAVGKERPARPRVKSAGELLRARVEAWARTYWDDLCQKLHAWQALLDTDISAEDPLLWQTVRRREEIERALDEFQQAARDPNELIRRWRERT